MSPPPRPEPRDAVDSAAPPDANPAIRHPARRGPQGPLGFVRESLVMGWRWLTRMRTALQLLGVVALLTLIATFVPQEPNVPSTVAEWRAGTSGPGTVVSGAIDAVGAYDVYGSPLFLALLLLVFLSLTACLIPRIRAWVTLVRRSRPPLVRHLAANDLRASFETDAAPDDVVAAAASHLRARRWRVRRGGDPTPTAQVAAEKGLWSREGGSLAFHLSFYVVLIAVVAGQLLTFEGQRGIIEGEPGFTDTAISYWSYQPGRWYPQSGHDGWQLELDRFHVDWVRDPLAEGAGQPTEFRSEVTVTPQDGEPYRAEIRSNEPLLIDGKRVTQLDWGYAPRVQVEVDGEVVHDDFLPAQRADGGFYRTAVKAPGAEPDVGLDLFLYPFAPPGDDGRPQLTLAPWAEAPLIVYRQYRGDLQLGATQQTIDELDTTQLESQGGAYLRPGDEIEVGEVTVRFVELRRWVGYQISERPQLPWLLAGACMLVVGLATALYAYRRRVWVLAERSSPQGRTLVTVAGRAFQRPDAFEDEHARVTAELAGVLAGEPGDAAPQSGADPAPVDPDRADTAAKGL